MEMNRDVLCKVELTEGQKETESERKKGMRYIEIERAKCGKMSRRIARRLIHVAWKKKIGGINSSLLSYNNAFSQSTLSTPSNFITISLSFVNHLSRVICLVTSRFSCLSSRFISLYYRALKLRKHTCEPSHVIPDNCKGVTDWCVPCSAISVILFDSVGFFFQIYRR